MRSVWVAAFLCCLVPASLFGEEPTDHELEITIEALEKMGLEDFVASALVCGCTSGTPGPDGCTVVTQPPLCDGKCYEKDSGGRIVRRAECKWQPACGCPLTAQPGNTIELRCVFFPEYRDCRGSCVDGNGDEIKDACGGDPDAITSNR